MALTRPILYSQPAFDATQPQTFTFISIGGSQVISNRLVITSQTTGGIVYASRQDTYSFVHNLPSNVLTNGQYYSAYIITFDSSGEASPQSAPIQFYCYSQPEFRFDNIPSNGILSNSSYNFELLYNQIEGERLESCTFNLYDAQRSLVATSGIKYVGIGSLPTIMSHTFGGMLNFTNYYIQAVGVTVNGTKLSTEQISLYVSYSETETFNAIELTNNCSGGYIIIKSNLIAIDGSSNPSPPIYTEDGTSVSLRNPNHYVEWNSGYELTGDFTASLWGRDFNENSRIIRMEDANGNYLIVNYRSNGKGYYAELAVFSNGIEYYIYSNLVPIVESTDELQIWFRRVDDLYEIILYNITRPPVNLLGSGVLGAMVLGNI